MKPILGQEAICPDGLGRVKGFCFLAPHNWIQVDTYVGNRSCQWDANNVTLIPPYPAAEIARLKIGNTKLLYALMAMVSEFFYGDSEEGPLRHNCMLAEEVAIGVLLEAGMAHEKEDGYYMDWDAIEARINLTIREAK